MTLDGTQFAHALGRISCLQSQMLNQNEIERMIGAANAKEAFKILNETSYSSHMLDVEDVNQFQAVVDAGLVDTANLLKEITPRAELLNILWYTYDVHNLKTLFKGKFQGIEDAEVDKMLSKLGSVDSALLARYFREDNSSFPEFSFGGHTEKVEGVVKSISEEYKKTEDYNIVDAKLDKLYFELITEVAVAAGDEFLSDFVRKNLDLYNLQVILRLKALKESASHIKGLLVEGGTYSMSELEKMAGTDVSKLSGYAKDDHYRSVVDKAVSEWESNGTLFSLERESQELITNFVRTAKTVTFGIAPIVAFFFAKNNNAQIIRMIMLSKIADVDHEVIRGHVRNLY